MGRQQGHVFALSTSADPGVPKYPHEYCALVERYGMSGDYHNRPMRPSFSQKGIWKPNDRQVSLLAHEVLVELNEVLEGSLSDLLEPGSLGENITTTGLGDLSDIPNGSLVHIGEQVVLRVTCQNEPCKKLSVYSKFLPKKVTGKRGLLCTVESGVGSRIVLNDPIRIILPQPILQSAA